MQFRNDEALFAPAEVIVQAGAHDIVLHRDIVGRRAATGAAIKLAEIDVEIFGLSAPVAGQRNFNPAADGPAGIGGAVAGKARSRRLDVTDGETAGQIGHDAAEGVAGAAAHGGEPAIAGAATRAAARIAAAFEVRPVEIAFEAEHSIAVLPVVTGGAADLAAGRADAGGLTRPPGMTPAAAAVGADIETGPVIDRRILRRRRLVERRDRKVGSVRALRGSESTQHESGGDDFLHRNSSLTGVGAVMRAVRHSDFTHNFLTPGLPAGDRLNPLAT
jgi:hypothetical protein